MMIKSISIRVIFQLMIAACFTVSYAQYNYLFPGDKETNKEEHYTEDKVHKDAFNELKEELSPMSTKQIKEVKKLWLESQRASTLTADSPAKPINSSMMISLENGSLPSVIRLGAGVVSVVSFFDATGKPWPIRGYNVGNPSVVNIIWNEAKPEEEQSGNSYSNTLMMQAQSIYKSTNMVVLLKGLSTPILIELIPGQKEVDYRLDIQVPKSGPNARTETRNLPKSVSPIMLDILNNVPPSKSVKAHVMGGEAQAWLFNKKLYVRTPIEIISPAWISKVNGANNEMHVYEMPFTTALLGLVNGKIVKLKLEGV